MSVSILDVAKIAKVAPSTVSNVLTHKKYVSPEITERVNKVCQELGYKPNYFAMSLAKKETKLIGLFLTVGKEGLDDFFNDLVKGVGKKLSESGYHIVLFLNIEEEGTNLLSTSKGLMDGVIVLSPLHNDFRINELVKEGVPYVLIGKPSEEYKNSSYVDANIFDATYQITKKLLDSGHKRILFLNSAKNLTISDVRYSGYKRAYLEKGLKVDDDIVVNLENNRKIVSTISNLLDKHDFTACITESDIVAQKVYECIKGHSDIEIGKNFAVAALGGEAVTNSLNPILTTVSVDYEELGKRSAEMIVKLVSNKEMSPQEELVKPKIIYTKSTDFKLQNNN